MQQEKNQQLEELDTLEGFVQLGCNLPYGPYVLFKRLANHYPLHFVQCMHQQRNGSNPDGAETRYQYLPTVLSTVDSLSRKLEHYLIHEPQTDEERAVFQSGSISWKTCCGYGILGSTLYLFPGH